MRKFDANGDGVLSLEEFKTMLKAIGAVVLSVTLLFLPGWLSTF